ncbi:MAG: CDP-alcohol phosphatidyltransferase family protein [Candidatus Veblenbacteria bacterium]|nr:CDP-alcohol phosphatidyltransferase family protein [Candidatus Veblenbacteria bacterium]MDZ4230061.1 CDP-alcohol phosphatidyltransferase family protein [Candidatus Veblenbacteria bacterium]
MSKFAEFIIPRPETRQTFRRRFKTLVANLSHPLSNIVDKWIETDVFTVANMISFGRALAGPVFLIFVIHDAGFAAYISVLALVVFSDYFDGVIAKKMNQQSETGGAVDAGCDKVFAFFAATGFYQHFWLVPLALFALFDLILIIMALVLSYKKRHNAYRGTGQIKANHFGKLKFNFQALTLVLFLFNFYPAGNYTLIIADVFALGSIIRHLRPAKENV